jgi:leucyl aminopeptidase
MHLLSTTGEPLCLYGVGNEQEDLEEETVASIGAACGNLCHEHRQEGSNLQIFLPPLVLDNPVHLSTFTNRLIERLMKEDKRYKRKREEEGKEEGKEEGQEAFSIQFAHHHEADETGQFSQRGELEHVLAFAKATAEGSLITRDLVTTPANDLNPTTFRAFVEHLVSQHADVLSMKALSDEECRELGMTLYLSVNEASAHPASFVHVTYTPPPSSSSQEEEGEMKRIALIGKSVTFDAGGYSMKSPSNMELMKFDMGGGAAVTGTLKAIALLQPPNLVIDFILPMCENMVSDTSTRPGDVVSASNGLSVEILNTDAEGRLALADALVYATSLTNKGIAPSSSSSSSSSSSRNLPPVTQVVDMATLTGACMVSLGLDVAGVWSNDDSLFDELHQASTQSAEHVWRLPLHKSYKKGLVSSLADLKNMGPSRYAGAIYAALFLQHFVGSNPSLYAETGEELPIYEENDDKKVSWAHIDMAGPVWDYKSKQGTGYGVKLLTSFLVNKVH